LTVAELLDGRTIDMPPVRQTNVTHKKAPKAKGRKGGPTQRTIGDHVDSLADEGPEE
jgi:hypothetical protein